jgi:hypothetical protein
VVLQGPRSLFDLCPGSSGDAFRVAREAQRFDETESSRLAKRSRHGGDSSAPSDSKDNDGHESDTVDEKELSRDSHEGRDEGKTYYDTLTGEISHNHSGDTSDSERGSEGSLSPPRPRPWPTQIPEEDPIAPVKSHRVNRRERAMLLSVFRREQRLARRCYIRQLRATFDAEIEEGKAEGADLLAPFFPTEAECLAEAWENYCFDHMMAFDHDQAHQIVVFRSSLSVMPQHPSEFDEALSRARTTALWAGLRRVYFDESEREMDFDHEFEVGPDHEQVMNTLRTEVAGLEQRAEVDNTLSRLHPDADDRPPLLPFRDNEDDDPPSLSLGIGSASQSSVTICPLQVRESSDSPASGSAKPGSQSDAALSVFDFPVVVGKLVSAKTGSQSEATIPVFESVGKLGSQLKCKLILLSTRVLRRVLAAKESLFKYGMFVPKNDREADSSPEASRWKAGRDLEWLRLGQVGTFDGDWTWDKVCCDYPTYNKSDIGFLFYVYDFKFSGEHRVRLVFDGSRQSPSTYAETYAPTVRAESVRLFHIVCVEEGYHIGQYDVPQAFLKADIDHDIFAYPPKGQSSFPGQILKLRRALYGGKQSAFLWFQMMNLFLLELGFTPSPLDACFYRRSDALLILYCDDLRIGAMPEVLSSLHASLLARFDVTTAPGNRFLGMDTTYQLELGYLKLSMCSYIVMTFERFRDFDLSQGCPFRELVGCLLWITLNVMGPELLRVKDLARRSNSFTEVDYRSGLKVLDRIYDRRDQGIVMFRHAAGREIVPASSRLPKTDSPVEDATCTGSIIGNGLNELTQQALCKGRSVLAPNSGPSLSYAVDDADGLDLHRISLPINSRYSLVVFADASFAVGESKQSVTGYVVFLNGSPLLWGSLKQTIVVDSSCSAEFVAASVACKQLIHAENMVGFLGFSCPKPYRMYTDSLACLHIATNPSRLGNVRHLQIRYHLVRCYVSLGDVTMFYCITEEMIADLFTKIVAGAQDQRLSLRFYSLHPASDHLVLGLVFGSSPVS